MEKKFVLKNYLDSKINWMEKLHVLKTTWIQNLIRWKNYLHWKTTWIKKLVTFKSLVILKKTFQAFKKKKSQKK
jgi:hypothetical protein